MGLSGRKVKQRIPNDPRNLSWADDAARFGSSYLSKFGWDASQGLGVGGEGRRTHIKVEQKLDMMGIGAAHQKDPNGIAWKQNKDFENLLKRLNDANGSGSGSGDEDVVVDGFVKPKETKETGDVDEEKLRRKREKKEKKERKKEKKEKKRKEKDGGEKEKKKKRKRDDDDDDGVDKKSKKNKRKTEDSDSGESSKAKSPEPTPVIVKQVVRAVPRHRAHRARAIAAKSIASKSAAAISEILGIAPSASTSQTSSGTQTPQEGKLTSIYDDHNEDLGLEKITTSTKSMQDYFKEKMGQLKSSTVAIVQKQTIEVDYDDIPRSGLGSRPKAIDEDDAPRLGLSKFSSLMSSSFMAATSLTTFREEGG